MNKNLIEIYQKREIIHNYRNKNKNININKKYFKRNYGIDLARIISMFFIVCSHVNYQGGPLFHFPTLSFGHKMHIFLKIIYCPGVNIFGMISGYIGFSHKYSNLLYHLITTFFYNILIAIFFKYFTHILIKDIKKYLYPVFQNYWYFNEYFKMFFFINLINKGIISMDFKSMKNFIFILFFVFSCFGIIKNFDRRLLSDIFALRNGFSYNWLIILYCYGSFLGKFKIYLKKNFFFNLKYIFLFLFISFIKFIINITTLNNKRIGKKFDEINYTTPSVVLLAISFIKLFSNFNIKNELMIKFISFLSPLTFGIYLIHGHILFLNYIISNKFLWILKYKNFFIIFLLEISCSIGIFVFCSLVDFIRDQLFKLIKLKKLCILIEILVKKTFEKI